MLDTMNSLILLHGVEVWDIYNFKEIDKFHVKLCKRILGLPKQTHTSALLGALDISPLSIFFFFGKEMSLTFCIRLMKNPIWLISNVYLEQCNFIRCMYWSYNSIYH